MAERVIEQSLVPIEYPGGSREAAMAGSIFDVSQMDPHLDYCDAVTLRHQLLYPTCVQPVELKIDNRKVPDIILDDKKAMDHAALVRALDASESAATEPEKAPSLVRRITGMVKPEHLYATAYVTAMEIPRILMRFY
jgi:hypothetical protein